MREHPKALIVEDHRALAVALSARLERIGYRAVAVPSLAMARRELQVSLPAVVLLDLGLPDGRGLELIEEWAGGDFPPTAILTAHGEIDHAIAAKKAGVAEFFVKPVDFAALDSFLKEVYDLARAVAEKERFSMSFIGTSMSMREVFQQVARACAGKHPVVIQGDAGTGRSHVAHLIHQHLDVTGASVVLPCYASQSREQWRALALKAENGTLVLDGVDELPIESQLSLCEVMGEYPNVKYLAISSAGGLRELVQTHQFHPDLYYRLQGGEVSLPSLQDRGEDFQALCSLFLAEIDPANQRKLTEVTIAQLKPQSWPGNIRELKQVLRFAMLNAGERIELSIEDFPSVYQANEGGGSGRKVKTLIESSLEEWLEPWFHEAAPAYKEIHDSLEFTLLQLLLDRYDGNQAMLARSLDMNRSTLRKKLRHELIK